MDFEKILELLKVENLDEAVQDEVKQKLQDIVEVQATEKANSLLESEKEKLLAEFEQKFDDYKEEITSKFSNFVDAVLDEELTIPEKIEEFARKGELYSDVIEVFKTRLAVDEGMLNDEVSNLLSEAKETITDLRGQLDTQIAENLEVKEDAQTFAVQLYLRDKMEGLTESQRKHVLDILGDSKSKDEIDRKFDIVVESMGIKVDEDKEEIDEDANEDNKDGKGVTEVSDDNDKEDKIEEDSSPWKTYLDSYATTLKTNKL